MGFLSRFKKDTQQKEAVEIEVENKTEKVEAGEGVEIGIQGKDDSFIALARYSYIVGRQPRTDVIRPFDNALSFVAKDNVYSNEKVEGFIRIEDYNEGGKKEISVLSYESNPIPVEIPLSVRAPGSELKGTLSCDVYFDGEPRKIAQVLKGSHVKKKLIGNKMQEEYATAKDLAIKYQQSLEDVSRMTLNLERVYEDTEELQNTLAEKFSNHGWFMDRGLTVANVFIHFPPTELEKINDEHVRLKYEMMNERVEQCRKALHAKSAAENKEIVKDASADEYADDVKQI